MLSIRAEQVLETINSMESTEKEVEYSKIRAGCFCERCKRQRKTTKYRGVRLCKPCIHIVGTKKKGKRK
jgi:hypothetical protein